MESNPYKIEGPALISFSGGRTSGFMVWNIIQAHGGTLPEDVYVTFANTGKEAPETLDFVHEIGQKWGVKIHWLELYFGEERPVYRTKEVTYETASRNGEPFEALIDRRKYLPNPVARFIHQSAISGLSLKSLILVSLPLRKHKSQLPANVLPLKFVRFKSKFCFSQKSVTSFTSCLALYMGKHPVRS